eukprot:CAMPEP_0175922414 /NCGR_PEP_ID=MMETSP0108-20121206/14030_1 /TAXON_ID=195067 ORGANISM="Goniomonas pacifica, Strain CCMP1869" /NCGR_SAMPLE_ID=MMETSP0108 /ASSEMBLY_ACC=CAM_ASM_000204 /LENGTH=110 /DNA_ID=CAMNT_0017245357 /DNA_START=442 /DNA_END=770 /DNA_ORIENTATION=-
MLNTSHAVPVAQPSSTSGAMNPGVPAWGSVGSRQSVTRWWSISTVPPPGRHMMVLGLTSMWTRPRAWLHKGPEHIERASQHDLPAQALGYRIQKGQDQDEVTDARPAHPV